jgi:anti-anti-sigma factor
MKFNLQEDILNVSEIMELATATANSFQSELSAALSSGVKRIVLDLSQTTFVDCGGLGALVALRKKASNGHGTATVRLLNPPKPFMNLVNMMQMGDIFPIEMNQTIGAQALEQAHAA